MKKRAIALHACAALICAGLLMTLPVQAQKVTKHPDESRPLTERIQWGHAQNDNAAGYWIGYSITKLMRADSYMGSWGGRGLTTLASLIGSSEKAELNNGSRGSGFIHGRRGKNESLVEKEIGILFYFKRGDRVPADIVMSNVSLNVDLKGKPLVWVFGASQSESIAVLGAMYDTLDRKGVKEDAIRAIGIHDDAPGAYAFLVDVFNTESAKDLREEAIFWIGQQDTEEALTFIRKAIQNDPSTDVREKAVFGLGQMSLDEALNDLIRLARTETNTEVRKSAIFWLGQKAAKRAKDTIEEVIYSKDEVEIQKHAVFALSQYPADEAIPKLIEVAKSHFSVEVRKQAIFWLGESGEPEAVDFLVSLVEE